MRLLGEEVSVQEGSERTIVLVAQGDGEWAQASTHLPGYSSEWVL